MTSLTLAARVERLTAVADIQNLMGRHVFYKAAGYYKHLLGTFAQHTGPVTVELADWGVYEGLDGVRTAYIDPLEQMAEAAGGRAGTLLEEAVTTPVIQVSDDATSAHGVWMVLAAQSGPGPGTGELEAGWAWVHFAADFVREEDGWRILNLRVVPRWRAPYGTSWVAASRHKQPPPPLATPPDRPSTAPLNDYSVTHVPSYDPVPPDHRFAPRAAGAPQNAVERRIQRLEDVQDIHNLMGMHEYLHAAGRNGEEFELLFAKDAPGLTFEPEDWGVFEGADRIKDCYVDNAPPNPPGIMTEHAATTPVIEVAEDGLTAKGVWISPGHETFPIPGAEPIAHWSWGRYGIDFIKVDGEWKFWHFHIYTTFRTPYDQSWVDSARNRPPYFPAVGEVLEGMEKPPRPVTFNQPYHPDTAQIMQPVPPVPYRTFAETWSYTEDPR